MVTGRQCSWHTGRHKLKLGSEIQNALLNSREQVLQGEKAKLTNNACTCCKFIFPSSSSPLPATKNRELRSEECVLHWRHVTWFLNDFRTSNRYLLLLSLGDPSAKMPGAPWNSWVVCKKSFKYFRLCVIPVKWIHWHCFCYFVFLALFCVLLIVLLRILMYWKQTWKTLPSVCHY